MDGEVIFKNMFNLKNARNNSHFIDLIGCVLFYFEDFNIFQCKLKWTSKGFNLFVSS